MDKDAIQNIADQIADDMGYDYFDLSPKMQIKIYDMAMDQYQDMLADKADMMRKNEASGGMMRANYRDGSPDDIPEQEDIPLEEFQDLLKSLGANKDQASGIKSLQNKRMASDPDLYDSINEISLQLFGKPMDQLDEVEEIQLQEYLDDKASSKRKSSSSIKMAEGYKPSDYDPMIVEEYEKYKFDAQEQGQPVMSIDEFLQMQRAGAMGGGIMRAMYSSGDAVKTYPDPITARIETEKEEAAQVRENRKTSQYPIKKTRKKIDLDVDKIQELINRQKEEKAKKAKGGIAGVL